MQIKRVVDRGKQNQNERGKERQADRDRGANRQN